MHSTIFTTLSAILCAKHTVRMPANGGGLLLNLDYVQGRRQTTILRRG